MGRPKKSGPIALAVAKQPTTAETVASLRSTTGAVVGLAAAWLAAGSLGVMVHPLRHALTWVALAVVAITAWPPSHRSWKQGILLGSGVIVAASMTMSPLVAYNVFAVTLVLAMAASMRLGLERRILTMVAFAAGLLGFYRLATMAFPAVWLLADSLSDGLGRLAGSLTGRPLRVGASFAGLDFLFVMGVVYVAWLISTPSPRLRRALYGLAAILVGQMLYLAILSCAADLRAALPPPPLPPESDQYIPPDWSWSAAVASLLPWNLPLVGAAIQLAVAAAMLRWVSWLPAKAGEEAVSSRTKHDRLAWNTAVWILAALVPLVAVLSLGNSSLSGKQIVVYDKGYLNWLKPVFDRYGQSSAGAYGMLPEFIESLGGRLIHSDKLSDADLAKADVLVLLHPLTPWPDDLQKRVWDFVRRGGALLVAAEPRVLNDGQTSAFDEVLAPTAIRVRNDTAVALNYKWEQSYAALAHPATTGVDGEPNQFGLMRGSSLDVRWPARPILIGQWGWSDPGSDAVMTLGSRYEPGERLGDLVLAAEQRVGQGTVVVLADSYGLKNEGLAGAYPFTARLLGYLAWRPSNPQSAWRQILGLAACLALVGLIIRQPLPAQLALVVVVLGGSLAFTTDVSSSHSRVLPGSPKGKPFRTLAYIDAAHTGAYSSVDWTYDDTVGLRLNLMRSGYLPLLLPEFSAEALQRAGLLITIAPAREYSPEERQTVREFVDRGGTFICMAGAEHARPINPLLADFGFRVPLSPLPVGDSSEPLPMGNLRGAYLSSPDYRADVLIFAGWPIEFPRPNASFVVGGWEGLPVIACAKVGEGRVVVIGDSAFASNKNLETVTGEPFEGRYDNACFWRWLTAHVTDQPSWTPPGTPVTKKDK